MANNKINQELLFNELHFNLIINLYKSSYLDFNSIDDVYKKITETAIHGLHIKRASYWEINNDELECKDLFDIETGVHTKESNLSPNNLPIYFDALKNGIAIVANDVLTNKYTQELKEGYLIPHGISNMLDLPIRKKGKLIGVFCCEHNDKIKKWTPTDLAFARILSDILSLIIEQSNTRAIEKQLIENQRKLNLITTNSKDGFVVIENSNITYISPTYLDLLGYSNEEIINGGIDIIFKKIHKKDLDFVKETIYSNLKNKTKYFKYEFRLKGKNGKYIWREDSACVLYNSDGSYSKYIIISRDTSQIKAAELKSTKLEKVSKNLNSKLLEFTHIVSHNIRSNTSNITMLLDLIEETTDASEKEEYFSLLKQSNKKLNATLLDLNEAIDIQLNSDLQKSEINISNETEKIIASFLSEINQDNCIITTNIPKNILLQTIPTYFESILKNLISNAIKYQSPNRKLELDISVEKLKSKIKIIAKDNGIGIDLVKNKNKIFGMYKTFTNNPNAIGLGLYMIKNKINVLGGTITVESKLEKGTKFTITI